jgi:protein TonB
MMKPLYLAAFFLIGFAAATRAQSPVQTEDFDKTFTKAEVMPEYPGGDKAWMAYLNKNLHYPMDAISNEISGTIWVQFIVKSDSTVSDVQAFSGPTGGGLREEAVRVIKESGKWAPALQNGRVVKCYAKRPIKFVLQRN